MRDHVEGRVIGRYELLLRIARGGMGTVHLARMRGMGGFERDVALKLAHEHLDGELATQDLFEEARIAARLRHPNVVPVLDVGEDEGRPYIVMDYVEGDSLAGLVRLAPKLGEPLPVEIGLHAIADSLAGLHAAHELVNDEGEPLTLVHRDFSPQNVLVGLDGLARLSDFGVAKLLAGADTTQSGVVKGKIRYMSPEQARGDTLDRRSDVWAAGVVLWELLARERLFTGENDANVLLKIVSEPPRPLREVAPDVHPALEAVITRALERELEDRTPTASALRQELKKAIREAGLEIEQEDVAEFVRRVAGPVVEERRARAASVARATGSRMAAAIPVDKTEVMIGAPVARAAPIPRRPEPTRRIPTPVPEADHELAPKSQDTETTSAHASLVRSGAPPIASTRPARELLREMIERQPPLHVALAGACGALLLVGAILIVVSLVRRHGGSPDAAAATTAAAAAAAAANAGASAAAGIVATASPTAAASADAGAGAP